MGQRKMSPADLAARNEKIIKLWNEGLGTATLGERFRMAQATVAAIIDVARRSGQKVREAPRGLSWE